MVRPEALGLACADSVFVQFWNDILAPKFIRYKHVLADGLSVHSEAAFPLIPVKTGDHVLDVGCGFGDTAIKLAKVVGPRGKVVGIDCCEAFLCYARNDTAANNLINLKFICGDAEFERPPGDFDLVFSRFGTMFFANPMAALKNIRRGLKPGGEFVHIVWRDPAANPWLSVAKDILLKFLPPPGPNARTCGPGPFSMANKDIVKLMMQAAGYVDIRFDRIDASIPVGADLNEAVALQLAIGPAGEIFREAGALAEDRRDSIEAALRDILVRQKQGTAGIVMDSSSWVVSARNPD